MALQAIIFLLLGIVILILVAINGFLLWYFYKTDKKIDALLEKGLSPTNFGYDKKTGKLIRVKNRTKLVGDEIKDFKDIFLSQKEKNNDLEEQIKEAFLKIKNLDNISERTIQKVGVVRFNPFNDLGGNQSFVIALLDNQNNGFVISSLFIKEGNRVYAKFINAGKSDHLLSKEEMEAISHANAR